MSGRTKNVMPLLLALGGAAACAVALLGLVGNSSTSPAPVTMKEACTALAIDRATGVTREVPCAPATLPMLVAGKQR